MGLLLVYFALLQVDVVLPTWFLVVSIVMTLLEVVKPIVEYYDV